MGNDHRLNPKARTISTETELRSIAKDLVRVLSITTPIFFTVIMGNFIFLGGPLILLGSTYVIMTAANLTLNRIINRLPDETADPIRYIRGYANLGIFIWLDYHIPIGLNGWLIYIPFLMISAAFPKKMIHATLLLVFHWSAAVTVAFLKGESGREIYKIGLVSAIVAVFSLLFVVIFRKYIHALENEVLLRRKAEDEISKLAFQDSLTELPNRTAFEEFLITHLEKAEKSNEIFAILFIDLEEFKKANDLFGHRFGDSLLIFVGKRLLQALRPGGMVARFGGDEFVILLNDIKREQNSVLFAKKINRLFDDYFTLDDRMVHVTASIGISIYPNHSRDPHKLIQYADMAMYRAKIESKNHFRLYDSSMGDDLQSEIQLEQDLNLALLNDEFYIAYQPKVDMEKQLVGFEALIRWNRKNHGLYSPDKFIPVLEKNRQIIPMGYYALDKVCRQLVIWREQGFKVLPVSINLSPYQFQDRNLFDIYITTINKYRLNPSLFELEVTESSAMADIDHSIKLLRSFKEAGLSVALDDFGTGFSSLGHLNRLPLDTLKIDRSFIKNLDNFVMRPTVLSIIDLARNHGLMVLAEGVETSQQFLFLKENGCHMIQGYFIHIPLTPEEAEKLLGDRV